MVVSRLERPIEQRPFVRRDVKAGALTVFQRMLIFLILAFLPFQSIGFSVGTTIIDISNVIFALFALSLVFTQPVRPISKQYVLFLITVILAQCVIFLWRETPATRFLSTLVWLGSMFVVYGWRHSIPLNPKQAYFTLCAASISLFLIVAYDYFFLGIARPAGTMAEPSVAGLVLVAFAASMLMAIKWSRNNSEALVLICLTAVFVYLAFLIRSTHLVTFVFSVVVIAILSRALTIGMMILIFGIMAAALVGFLTDDHYLSRLDLDVNTTNLSTMSWLQGFDQMVESLVKFPIIGAGFGGTGQFEFYSYYSILLSNANIADLNRLDAYSGFFRLVIEAGPLIALAIFVCVAKQLKDVWVASKGKVPTNLVDQKYRIALLTFGFTLIVGILLKEPTFSRSQFAVAILLFCSVNYGPKKLGMAKNGQPSGYLRGLKMIGGNMNTIGRKAR